MSSTDIFVNMPSCVKLRIMEAGRFAAKTADQTSMVVETWRAMRRITCTISRNCAQPIPHHASAHAVIVTELVLGETRIAVGQKMFPEMFSSCPDLSEWADMDRRGEAYSRNWSQIRTGQVHATAVSSDAYTSIGEARNVKWDRKQSTWQFQCHVDINLASGSWVYCGDLAVLTIEEGIDVLELRGTVLQAKADTSNRPDVDPFLGTALLVEVELCKNSQPLREAHEAFVDKANAFHLYFISIPSNEKKSIQMMQTISTSPPLQNMRLTVPRTLQQQRREQETRPLLTVAQARWCQESDD